MSSEQTARKRTRRMVGRAAAVLFLGLLVYGNVYQAAVLGKLRRRETSQREQIRACVERALINFIHDQTGTAPSADFLGSCVYDISHEGQAATWNVSIKHREVEGSDSTVIYTFKVVSELTAAFDRLEQSGAL